MLAPLDPTTLPGPVQRILGAPAKVQELSARGVAPGVKPGDLILVLVALSQSETENIRTTANKTLDYLPEPVLQGALGTPDLHPQAIDALAIRYHARMEVFEKLIAMPQMDIDTVESVCRICTELGAELLATNEERLLKHPKIIELLYFNKNTRMSTTDRMVELAVRNNVEVNIPAWKEAALAIRDELIMEASDEASPDDLLFQEALEEARILRAHGTGDDDTHDADDDGVEHLKAKFLPLNARIAQMTTSQKIRTAMVGAHEEIMLLIRDSNRMVATAAAKSPQMSESDAEKIASNRGVSQDVLGIIGHNPEFTKRYTIKKALVDNPKTPVMVSMMFIKHLRESDLKLLEKSKNVSGPVRDAIKHHLQRRKA